MQWVSFLIFNLVFRILQNTNKSSTKKSVAAREHAHLQYQTMQWGVQEQSPTALPTLTKRSICLAVGFIFNFIFRTLQNIKIKNLFLFISTEKKAGICSAGPWHKSVNLHLSSVICVNCNQQNWLLRLLANNTVQFSTFSCWVFSITLLPKLPCLILIWYVARPNLRYKCNTIYLCFIAICAMMLLKVSNILDTLWLLL